MNMHVYICMCVYIHTHIYTYMSTAGVFRGFDEGSLLFFAITLEPRVE